MTERDRYDDSDHGDAARRAERATRWGRRVIGSVTGLLGCALIAAVCFLLAVARALAVAGMDQQAGARARPRMRHPGARGPLCGTGSAAKARFILTLII
ncbi:hypothetical protein P1P75_02435 [Streptomyces sp. ID05-39B]|uniref:hypothetical protein n=1 Tax=Streptomyces sp. ID05-39B TaxID=3028664 RepID=UPI0029BD4296|nr:hypothetical protein [Streptomyces sp. ID05-39B]MDX3525321.1 hypothetical protein [Streptomyces sp. ID05-39B]